MPNRGAPEPLRWDEPITAEALKNRFLGKDEQTYMLLEVFKEHNRKMAALVDTEFAAGTLERYEVSMRRCRVHPVGPRVGPDKL